MEKVLNSSIISDKKWIFLAVCIIFISLSAGAGWIYRSYCDALSRNPEIKKDLSSMYVTSLLSLELSLLFSFVFVYLILKMILGA